MQQKIEILGICNVYGMQDIQKCTHFLFSYSKGSSNISIYDNIVILYENKKQ